MRKKIAKLEKEIIGLREEEREETGIIEYNYEKKETDGISDIIMEK